MENGTDATAQPNHSGQQDKAPTSGNKMASSCQRLIGIFTRTKHLNFDVMDTNLRRCLSTSDVTLLGIGHMVGSGVYVLSATVAKNMAGPGIVLAFIISGFASFLAALCYAELGVRFPRAGSAYSYTYLALGELWAFIVGWNVALENVIGIAAVARSCSAYINSLANGVIQNGIDNSVGTVHVSFFSEHIDFLALVIVIAFVIFLSFGVRATSYVNNIFSVINICVILLIIGTGAYFSDTSNWTNPKTGGFLPFGMSGVLRASASCFYAYIGFDSVATAGEEAKDPQKTIPRATVMSMAIATIAYVGVSTVLTMMVNYKDIANDAGLPEALGMHGAMWAKYVVIIGAVCGMATALIGTLFALTRVIYAMAEDGLIFLFFSRVNAKTQIPLEAMYIFSALSGILTLTLNIDTLVEVMSIGTLLAYLVVSASVIVLRYQPAVLLFGNSQELSSIGDSEGSGAEKSPDVIEDYSGQLRERFYAIGSVIPCTPGRLVTFCVFLLSLFMILLCAFVRIYYDDLEAGKWWAILVLAILTLVVVLSFILILMHRQTTAPLKYKVPLVPLFPAISILANAVLITNLAADTWIRLAVWMAIGFAIYFGYGIRHSKLANNALSPKSSLLVTGFSQAPTWGSLEQDLSHTNLPSGIVPAIEQKKSVISESKIVH